MEESGLRNSWETAATKSRWRRARRSGSAATFAGSVRITAGVRGDWYAFLDAFRLAPRVGANIPVGQSGSLNLTSAPGQPPVTYTGSVTFKIASFPGMPAGPEDVPEAYPVRIPWNGILVDDPNHPLDIERRVREIAADPRHLVAERGRIADGKVAEFQVTMKIGFKIQR